MKKEILSEIHYLQDKITTLKSEFSFKDIRISVFDGFHAILCNYLFERNDKDNSMLIETFREIFNDEKLSAANLKTQIQNHINITNAQLIIESWSNFELFISYLTKSIFTEEKKAELCNRNYNDLIQCCKKKNIDLIGINCVEKIKITEFHLVPSANKIESLISNLKSSFQKEEYLVVTAFLNNYGRLRNCTHSNYIFQGLREIKYEYDGIKYTFRPNEPIIMFPPKEDTIFKNYIRLREICEHIVFKVKYLDCIYDPSHMITE
jgi:hypothetical protein